MRDPAQLHSACKLHRTMGHFIRSADGLLQADFTQEVVQGNSGAAGHFSVPYFVKIWPHG